MSNLDRKTFIIAFIEGYAASSMHRFEAQEGKEMLKRAGLINHEKMQRLAEVNAIHCLLHDRKMEGENFTLGEVLDALNKTGEEADRITSALQNTARWKRS